MRPTNRAAVRSRCREFAEANPIQRLWRDSAVAARHAVILPTIGYEVYGKALLGRDDQITPLV